MAASDEKDRFGDKLHHVEKAREDQWAAERDRDLLAALRRQVDQREATEHHEDRTPKLFKRILCPIDFDENSLKAMTLAGRLAAQNHAELYLLHVCPAAFVPLGGVVTDRAMEEESAKRRIAEIAGQNLHCIHYEIIVTIGEPAERVIAVQTGLEIDLIAMGTHGRRAVPRLFLGSVAERVVREATCPVITIRQDRPHHGETA
jgi:nucleotide-binding universal stress UspA family protein